MKNRKKIRIKGLFAVLAAMLVTGCGAVEGGASGSADQEQSTNAAEYDNEGQSVNPVERDDEGQSESPSERDNEGQSANPAECETQAQSGRVTSDAALLLSHESGCYEEPFSLEITGNGVEKIYYTTDGSVPVPGVSAEYEGAIALTDREGDANIVTAVDPVMFDANAGHLIYNRQTQTFTNRYSAPADNEVDKATVIRAVGVDAQGAATAVVTGTYFIGAMQTHIEGICEASEADGQPLAVLSISGDYDDFFDYERGIYVKGRIFDEALAAEGVSGSDLEPLRKYEANYNQRGRDWERTVHVDYMESDGTKTACVLSQDCGIRVQGNYSRSDMQKGLRLYARKEYGAKDFHYAFFEDSKDDKGQTLDSYKKLTLRAGGNCAFISKYNDAYWERLLGDAAFETIHSRPCVVYLNGEYWGVYVLQEDYGDALLQTKHGVDKDSVVIYKGDAEKYQRLGYALDDGAVPEGETEETDYYFRKLLAFLDSHADLTAQEDYDAFVELVDPDSVMDYFAAEIWMNNKWDWPGKNWLLWRAERVHDETFSLASEYADGRWRFMLCDMDFGGWSASEVRVNTIREDNYKDYGLLDKNTENPAVRMFVYLMTNQSFRERFYARLLELDAGAFAPERALAVLDEIHESYAPLMRQFYVRYYGTARAADAVSNMQNEWGGGYRALHGYVSGRSAHLQTMIDWSEETMQTLLSGEEKSVS